MRISEIVAAHEHKCSIVNTTVVNPIPTRGNKIFNIFISYSGNNTKRDIEIRHATLNTLRIQQKVGNERVLMGTECLNTRLPGSLCFLCYVPTSGDRTQTSCLQLGGRAILILTDCVPHEPPNYCMHTLRVK